MEGPKDIPERLRRMCLKAEMMLDITIDGFVHHSMKEIKKAEEIGNEIYNEERELTASLVNMSNETAEGKEQLRAFVSAASHLQRVGEAFKNMLPYVRAKMEEDVLFSDKAIEQLKYLFENTRVVLKDAGDAFLTRNPFLKGHVLEKAIYLSELADSYAVEHEDRLIAGVCVPKAAPLFINILECIGRANWHTMKAVDRFFSPGEAAGE